MASASSLVDVAKKYPQNVDIEKGIKSDLHIDQVPIVTCAQTDMRMEIWKKILQIRIPKRTIPSEQKKEGNYRGMVAVMSPKTYRAVTSGDMNYFEQNFPWDQESPRGNTILHIAASLRYDELVKLILQKSRQDQLVKKENRTGDIPLHVAASAGHVSTVEIFFPAENPKSGEEQLSRVKNHEENTPLHVALKNGHEQVATFLFRKDPEVSYDSHYLNKEGKSPLFLAAEVGFVKLVELMMKEKSARSDKNIQPIVHVAIASKNIDLLETILTTSNQKDDLLKAKDDEGMTPLSYAAFTDHLDGVRYILQEFTDCAYISNEDDTFPIHVASRKGRIKIIKEFLQFCPDSVEMLTNENKTILHVAAENGKARAVRHMLKMPELEMLIIERDSNGNTPLHLASKDGHPKVVSILTWDTKVHFNLINNERMTALDIATNYSGETSSFTERLTWQALRYAGALRADQLPSVVRVKPQSLNQSGEPLGKPHSSDTGKPSGKPPSLDQSGEPPNKSQSLDQSRNPKDNYMDRVDTLLLVATLITTVTFAAGFTMPGGFSSSEPHQGMATFLERPMFHVFLITNTIAMYSSMTAVVALIWAHLGDLNLVLASFNLTEVLLGIALTMVSVTFMSGMYLVVSSLYWLANVVLIMGSLFLFILVVLFVPLYSPSSLHHYIPRYIFYYQLCLLIIVTQSDTDKEGES